MSIFKKFTDWLYNKRFYSYCRWCENEKSCNDKGKYQIKAPYLFILNWAYADNPYACYEEGAVQKCRILGNKLYYSLKKARKEWIKSCEKIKQEISDLEKIKEKIKNNKKLTESELKLWLQ